MSLRGRRLSALYQHRFDGLWDYRLEVWRRLVEGLLEPRYMHAANSILDLGAGHGEFILNTFAPIRIAMDLDPDIETAVGQAGITVLHHDCTTAWPIPRNSIDVVFSSNLLEHLTSKSAIELALGHAFEAIKPGGNIVLMGPNIRFVGDDYWDYWDHYIPLTENAICEVLRITGFDVVTVIPRFLPYTMSKGRPKPLWLVSLYLKLPLAWRMLGKQFLVVGSKPSPHELPDSRGKRPRYCPNPGQ